MNGRRGIAPGVALLVGALTSLPGPSFGDETAKAEAATFGIVGLLRIEEASKAPPHWWERTDLGPHTEGPLGDLWATTIHDVASPAGLTLSGTGEGAGGRVGGSVSREVATLAHGGGGADLDALDHGRRGLPGHHTARALRAGDGHVPADVIQRIVRDNFGQLDVCYGLGLREDPRLEGRVVVKFVIDHRGAVAVASDAGSDLPDPSVVTCVVRAFEALVFPASGDTSVTVVYPLVFKRPAP